MYVSPQERPLDALDIAFPHFTGGTTGGGTGLADLANPSALPSLLPTGDNVTRLLAPLSGASGAIGGLTSSLGGGLQPILNALASMLQQLAQLLTGGSGSGIPGGAGETQFANATASSTGDPHLAFNGTDETGKATNAKWDSMSDHTDLLDSDSFAGGYQIATKATQPNANGITYNQSASVATNGGQTTVTLDASGNASLFSNGQQTSIADGQSLDLGNGETIARANDGTLTVTDNNGIGGSIATTLHDNGKGVDVNVQASDVDLGGDLTAGAPSAPQAPQPTPIGQPIFAPIFNPGWRHIERRPQEPPITTELGNLDDAEF